MYTDTADEAVLGASQPPGAAAAAPRRAFTALRPPRGRDRGVPSATPQSAPAAEPGPESVAAVHPPHRAPSEPLRSPSQPSGPPRAARRRTRLGATFSLCLRYRITGLAAEAAFWVLLSLPALALGTVGVLGYLHGQLGSARAARLENILTHAAGTVLSQREVGQSVAPALHDMLTSGHADVVSVGFLIALWSGSRALNVAIDTITVASGQSGRRGIVRTRLLAFALYLPALLLGAAIVPLALAGTELLAGLAPGAAALLRPLAWPIAAAALVVFLTTLYHLALPDRLPWRAGLPGALVALAVWAAGSALLRVYFHASQYGATGAAGFGRIAATAAVLLWMYIAALAVLIGAVFNAVRAGTETETEGRPSPDPGQDPPGSGETAGEKAVEPAGARSENNPETAQFPSPRMTRSSA